MSNYKVTVLGAGLAGCEAALWLAGKGVQVELYEQKPTHFSPAHKSEGFAELICSNSLKAERLDSASGLLKEEMRRMGSQLLNAAEAARVADGADGTVCGAAFVAMLGLMMLETQLGWFPLAVFPAALAGALMALLLWDFPPAKLHPGRCGCLYAAGAIGCIPLCIGYAELSIPLALPFWVEGGMVVLQVLFCRWKGKPLFAAAPLHRWLEKRGMSAVNIFYSLCALSVCGLALAVRLARWA